MNRKCSVNEWLKVIGAIENSGRIEIDSVFPENIEMSSECQGALFLEDLARDIENSNAFSASDASYENNEMGGFWIITNRLNRNNIRNLLHHKN